MRTITGGDTPPTYVVDLSLPPRSRYNEVALAYKENIKSLTSLFDDLVCELVPYIPSHHIHTVARIFLRRIYSDEETEEIRGISEAVDVPMYLLVSLNVLLDLLMGCTSGGVRVHEGWGTNAVTKMLHFRTLDWGMDPLRDVVVQLQFVDRKSADPEKVIATSITYVGFVGVLTGVREGMSLSLNFRPLHSARTRWENLTFYWNHFMVLTGWRRSISSTLRGYLMPSSASQAGNKPEFHTISHILSNLPTLPSTAAYLIFSTGSTTYTLEKDNGSAVLRSSNSFIAVTNHDQDTPPEDLPTPNEELNPEISPAVAPTSATSPSAAAAAPTTSTPTLLEAIEESSDRLSCITEKWSRVKKKHNKAHRSKMTEPKPQLSITKTELIKWIQDYPTTNECTHFACIMDAAIGKVSWCRRYGSQIVSEMDMEAESTDGSEAMDEFGKGNGREVEVGWVDEEGLGGGGDGSMVTRSRGKGGKVRDRLKRERERLSLEGGDGKKTR